MILRITLINTLKKITALNNASLLYDELISIYKKITYQILQRKDKE